MSRGSLLVVVLVVAVASMALLAVVSGVSLKAASPGGPTQQQQQQQQQQVKNENNNNNNNNKQLPKLFDFINYKRLFKKSYKTLTEELVRAKMFMSRAMRAVISALRFKSGDSPYYLAVNLMSDMTREERAKMNNKQLGEFIRRHKHANSTTAQQRRRPQQQHHAKELPEFYLRDARPESVAAEFARLEGRPGMQELKELERSRAKELRRKRRDLSSSSSWSAAATRRSRRRREPSMDQLLKAPAQDGPAADGNESELSALSPETRAKVRTRVPSNNPAYEPIDVITMGLVDQQEEVNFLSISPTPTAGVSEFLQELDEAQFVDDEFFDAMDIDYDESEGDSSSQRHSDLLDLRHESDSVQESSDDDDDDGDGDGDGDGDYEKKEDEVFVDLRSTNCFLAPRFQGECGSCYAFAMVAIAEFLHCIKTGQLVAMSEQYMIDCGKSYQEGLNGCSGAGPEACGQFIHNFGAELRLNYPYAERELQCPYDEDVDLKTTGYIRTEIHNAVEIDEELWPVYLQYGPMWVGIMCSGDFEEYAGGVHQAECTPEHGYHAMVLIGHGREDGHEYWLFRNSYDSGWGEAGHYKLAREAPCIVTGGFMYGTDNGREFTMKLETNAANDGSFVQQHHYMRHLVESGLQSAPGASPAPAATAATVNR